MSEQKTIFLISQDGRSLGKYTKYECDQIDAIIDSQLHLITDTILENVPGVRSIILAGGFGKGEGSVEITQGGGVECLRDFDIVAIVDKIPSEVTQQRLHKRIHERLGLPNPESRLFRFSNFVVCVYFRRKSDLVYPDIWFYDLKAASQLLYGEDVRKLIPWNKSDVPPSSGLRILFEKVCGLLGVFSYSYLKTEKLPEQQKRLIVFECYKAFTEICTALSILANEYEPRYATRARNLSEFYSVAFPNFARLFPRLPRMVEKCTNFKLKPNFSRIREHPIELWFFTRDILGATLRLYLERYLGITLTDWTDLPDRARIVARDYYKPFLRPFVHKNLQFSNTVILTIAGFLYQTLTNLEYSYVVTRKTGRLYLHPLRRCYISPSLKFFQAGIMLLFSLNREGTVRRELAEKAANELRHCVPVEDSTPNTSRWESLRKHFLEAYNLCRGHHFVK